MSYLPKDLLTKVISYLVPRPNPKNCMDTIPELKAKLRQMCLKVGGTKLQLIHRLLGAGQYARRPFWDTRENARYWRLDAVCHRPSLTFDVNLHSETAWTAHINQHGAYIESLARRTTGPELAQAIAKQLNRCERTWQHYSRYARLMEKEGRRRWQPWQTNEPNRYPVPYVPPTTSLRSTDI